MKKERGRKAQFHSQIVEIKHSHSARNYSSGSSGKCIDPCKIICFLIRQQAVAQIAM
jgi:hypothetical protein